MSNTLIFVMIAVCVVPTVLFSFLSFNSFRKSNQIVAPVDKLESNRKFSLFSMGILWAVLALTNFGFLFMSVVFYLASSR